MQIARDTLEQMSSWGLSGASSTSGLPKEFPMAARVNWPADDLLAKLSAAIQKHWRATNLTISQNGGGIEITGVMETIDSMLPQSEGGLVRLFPVWPLAKDVGVERLSANGAFRVSGALKTGQLTTGRSRRCSSSSSRRPPATRTASPKRPERGKAQRSE